MAGSTVDHLIIATCDSRFLVHGDRIVLLILFFFFKDWVITLQSYTKKAFLSTSSFQQLKDSNGTLSSFPLTAFTRAGSQIILLPLVC